MPLAYKNKHLPLFHFQNEMFLKNYIEKISVLLPTLLKKLWLKGGVGVAVRRGLLLSGYLYLPCRVFFMCYGQLYLNNHCLMYYMSYVISFFQAYHDNICMHV